jgi:hypothetical protein
MTEEIWIPIAAVGIIAAVEVANSISRIGFRPYCMSWIGTFFRIGERAGLIQPSPTTQKPAKEKTRKDIKDL